MNKEEAMKLAKEYSVSKWNFDIVLYAGEEDGSHYFSCTREGRPKWSSMPIAIRINRNGAPEEMGWDVRMRVIRMAEQLTKF